MLMTYNDVSVQKTLIAVFSVNFSNVNKRREISAYISYDFPDYYIDKQKKCRKNPEKYFISNFNTQK